MIIILAIIVQPYSDGYPGFWLFDILNKLFGLVVDCYLSVCVVLLGPPRCSESEIA